MLTALRQTLSVRRTLLTLYGLLLLLALPSALAFFTTLQTEIGRSLAFENLLNGFDYTVYADFMHHSERAVSPLLSVGRWTTVLYVLLSLFLTGGILHQFAEPAEPYRTTLFWQASRQHVGRFVRLFGVTLLFVLAVLSVPLLAGTLLGIVLADHVTERELFFVGLASVLLAGGLVTLVLCISDYAKVILFRHEERNVFRAFGRAGRLVLAHGRATYGRYLLLIGIGTAWFGLYLLLDSLLPMRNWPTMLLMVVVQQVFIAGRALLKIWTLGTAYTVYDTVAPAALYGPAAQPAGLRTPDEPDTPAEPEPVHS